MRPRQDDRIESSAKKSYVFKTYLKGDDIKIQSTDGVVTLTGTVSEDAHKSLARETVANLPGVKSVDNQLKEKGDAPAANSDDWLIIKVKTTLFFHRNVNATKTEVFAKEGTVTLRGEAASAAQRDLTTEYAMDVEGVKKVINEMTVLTAATPSGEKTLGKKIDTMGEKMGEKMEAMGESIDDASITALVKTTLLYHRSTSALNTTGRNKRGRGQVGRQSRERG